MQSHQQTLSRAVQLQQGGQLPQAEVLCQQIVRENPQHADAIAFLGILACQTGRTVLALEYFARAIALAPQNASYRSNHGAVLQGLGRHAEAEGDFRAALRLDGKRPEVHFNLGTSLCHLSRNAEAEASYKRALELKPDYLDVLNHYAGLLFHQGKIAEAIPLLRRVLKLQPNVATAHKNLGDALRDLGGHDDEAAQCYRRSLEIDATNGETHHSLGVVNWRLGRFAEAVASYRRALERMPGSADTYSNLGAALRSLDRYEEAEACYRSALALHPNDASIHYNLGNALRDQGRSSEAIACFRRAIELRPDFPEALNNLGNELREPSENAEAEGLFRRAVELQPDNAEFRANFASRQLLSGDFEQGWLAYEWRQRVKIWNLPVYPHPFWDGSSLAGRSILLRAEQGLGDTLQFIRYAPLLKQQGGTVLLECPAELIEIMHTCPGIDLIVKQGNPLPRFDVQLPLMSVPLLLRTNLSTIPANVPYLTADAAIAERWKQELSRYSGFKIGIVWQGNPRFSQPECRTADQRRSIPLACFEPLARLAGVQLFSLQKGYGTEQLAGKEDWGIVPLGDALNSFMDTAAVMMNLDLIISADTSPTHLAGAIGRPVWTALPFMSCWRWLQKREDSLWYPTMRLFRQSSLGDWGGVFARLTQEVLRLRA